MRVENFGSTTLYLGDCREVLQGLNEPIAAAVFDPPYGTEDLAAGYHRHGGYGRRQLWDKGDGAGRTIANDKDLSVLEQSLPLIAEKVPCGWLMFFYGARKTREVMEITRNLQWFGEAIWDKKTPGLGFHIRYSHESIAVFRQGEPPRPPDAMLSVMRVFPESGELHPHQKPIEVMEWLVKWATPPDETVFDPFMGTGSTGVAALRLGRKFIGIELDEEYFDIACRRIEEEVRAKENGDSLMEGLGLIV